jgi:pyruvate formate lyase activating enzyme
MLHISGVQKFTILDYPGKRACIAFLPGCNFRCGFCHNPEFVIPEKIQDIKDTFINKDTFVSFLKTRQGLLDGVVISGGEPTVYSELPEFARTLKEYGFKVKLDTNGGNPGMVKSLIQKQLVDYVALDLKTSAASYEAITRFLAVEKIQETLRILLSHEIEYEVRTTCIKGVHTPDVFKELSSMTQGVQKYALQNFRPAYVLDQTFTQYTGFTERELSEIAQRYFDHIPQVIVR